MHHTIGVYMKKLLIVATFVAIFTLINAVVITSWNFDNDSILPTTGEGSLSLIGGVTDDGFNTGYPAAPSRGWSTTDYPAQGTNNRTAGMFIEVSSAGYQDIILSWTIRHSNTSANRAVLFYTLDKTAAEPIWIEGGIYNASSGDAWFASSFDGSDLEGLDDNPNLAFKIVSSFANTDDTQYVASRSTSTYAGGKWRFDDIVLEGTPALPYLSVSSDIQPFFATLGAISTIQSYEVVAQNLSTNLSITAPQYFKLRVEGEEDFYSQLNLVPRSGALSKTIQVIFQPIVAGEFSGDIVHSAGGVDPQNVSVTGSTTIPEPSSYPTSFTSGNVTYYQGWLSWQDATGSILPEAYLIKGSKIGFDEIIAPVDGVAETDKKLTKNVAYGTQTQLIFELNEDTTYYFKIYPYTNSGAAINYKADENAPLVTISTTIGPIGSTLNPGDIAFVEYASDSPDRFSFVLLEDVLENTKINFTDKAWNGTAFAANEETYEWRGVGRAYQKGEVIHIVEGILYPDEGIYNPDFEGFSNSGDQIIAYQGYLTEPSFIAAFSTGGWLESGTPDNNTSYLPVELILGQTALGFDSEVDNGCYSGITTGPKAFLLAHMNDPINWTRANSLNNISFPDWAIEVTSGLDAPLVEISLLNEDTVRLSWPSVAGASSYVLYSSQEPNAVFPSEWTMISAGITSTSADLNVPPQPLMKSFYRVVAVSN